MPEKIPPLTNKPIGIGSEKRIFAHPNNTERVIGEYREELTPEEIKSIYYFGKLVDILFPGNYVAPTQAGKDKISGISRFIAPKITLDQTAQQLADYGVADENYLMGEESSSFTKDERGLIDSLDNEVLNNSHVLELSTTMKQAGLPVDSFNSGNFTVSEDGSVRYLDVMQPFAVVNDGVILRCNTERLHKAIAEIENDIIREQANFYLSKILNLFEEAKTQWREQQPKVP